MQLVKLIAAAVLTVAMGFATAADELVLQTASGTLDKAEKDSLTVKLRGADGKFQKALTLKVAGTSKVTVLTPQNRGGKVILTQRDADVKDLSSGQIIAVIYTESGKDGPVLLSAVVQAVK